MISTTTGSSYNPIKGENKNIDSRGYLTLGTSYLNSLVGEVAGKPPRSTNVQTSLM